jgi:hypothetical protein
MRRRCAISRPRSFSGTALDRVQVVAFAADRRLDRGGASEMVLRSIRQIRMTMARGA